MTFILHNLHGSTPVSGPFFHCLLISTSMSPFLIPKSFSKKHITMNARKLRHNVLHQVSKSCFALRSSHVLPDDGSIYFYAKFSCPVYYIPYFLRILLPNPVHQPCIKISRVICDCPVSVRIGVHTYINPIKTIMCEMR